MKLIPFNLFERVRDPEQAVKLADYMSEDWEGTREKMMKYAADKGRPNDPVLMNDFRREDHPYHDVWKKSVTALRNRETGDVIKGRRGQLHPHLAREHGIEPEFGTGRVPGHDNGFWHPRERRFLFRNEVPFDSSDQRSALSAMRQ